MKPANNQKMQTSECHAQKKKIVRVKEKGISNALNMHLVQSMQSKGSKTIPKERGESFLITDAKKERVYFPDPPLALAGIGYGNGA